MLASTLSFFFWQQVPENVNLFRYDHCTVRQPDLGVEPHPDSYFHASIPATHMAWPVQLDVLHLELALPGGPVVDICLLYTSDAADE